MKVKNKKNQEEKIQDHKNPGYKKPGYMNPGHKNSDHKNPDNVNNKNKLAHNNNTNKDTSKINSQARKKYTPRDKKTQDYKTLNNEIQKNISTQTQETAFFWTGIDSNGKTQQGWRYATDIHQLKTQLESEKIIFLHHSKWRKLQISYQRSTTTLLQTTWQQMAEYFSAGLSIQNILDLYSEHSNHRWSHMWIHIKQQMIRGRTLSMACAQHPHVFDATTIHTLSTAEKTGKLTQAIKMLSQKCQQQQLFRQQMWKCFAYPVFLLFSAIGGLLLFTQVVLPSLQPLLQQSRAPLPWTTLHMLILSKFLNQHACLLLFVSLFVICCIAAIKKILKRWTDWQLNLLSHISIINKLQQRQFETRWCQQMALLCQTGTPLLAALTHSLSCSHQHKQRQQLMKAMHHIEQGTPLNQALRDSGCFSPLTTAMLDMACHSGKLNSTLSQLATQHHNQLNLTIEHLSKRLQPAMMLLLACIIGTLVCSIYLPIFQLGQSI